MPGPEIHHLSEDKALQEVHNSMLEGLSQLADYFGFSKVMGQLYGALLLSGEALSLDELMERLSISKASVSMNIRTLEHMGMVRQVWHKSRGDRRKYYEAQSNLLAILTNIISGREMRDVDRALTVMQENISLLQTTRDAMSPEDTATADLYIERVAQMQAMFRFAQTVISSVLAKVVDIDLDDVTSIEIS